MVYSKMIGWKCVVEEEKTSLVIQQSFVVVQLFDDVLLPVITNIKNRKFIFYIYSNTLAFEAFSGK